MENKVVELSQRQNGQRQFQLIAGDVKGDCKVKLAHGTKDNQDGALAKVAVPVTGGAWDSQKELQEPRKENERMKKRKGNAASTIRTKHSEHEKRNPAGNHEARRRNN